MTQEKLLPVHPGEALLEEFLEPMNLSQNKLALSIGVHPRRINEIVLKKRRITANTALRLGRFFGTTPKFGWVCRWTTTWTLKGTNSEIVWRMMLKRWRGYSLGCKL